MRVLILGGTGEARELAAVLAARPGVEVISSLAGRVRDPALPVGETVVGGFGGTDGLVEFLRERGIQRVVDATHPFAGTISAHAVAAAARAGLPLLVLSRPGWTERDGDRWHRVADVAAAAARVRDLCPPGSAVLVTTGRRDLAPFVVDGERHYVIRSVDAPTVPLPARHTVLLDRGPYTVEGETALIARYGVAVLVTKDSGGAQTRAKLDAARAVRLSVVMVDRPPPDDRSDSVPTVAAAVRWVGSS